jgi:hypothetical protein
LKEYTIKHETTGEERKIKAISIDSSTHKYQWTFWGVESTGEIAMHSQRWNIIEIKDIEE